VLGLIINIVANFFLIKIYGIIGAAIATLLASFVAFYFSSVVFSKTRFLFKMNTRSFIGGPYRIFRDSYSFIRTKI
jgi:Na+-driven multidrug efflux pump